MGSIAPIANENKEYRPTLTASIRLSPIAIKEFHSFSDMENAPDRILTMPVIKMMRTAMPAPNAPSTNEKFVQMPSLNASTEARSTFLSVLVRVIRIPFLR